MRKVFSTTVLLVVVLVVATSVVLASSGAPTVITAKPTWDGTQWTFQASNDTFCDGAPNAGPCEKICLEIALDTDGDHNTDGDKSNWTKFNATSTDDPDANANQSVSTFIVTPPAWAKNLAGNNKVTFQFYMVNQSAADCNGASYSFTGWQPGFNTGPNAITLQSLSVTASAWPLAGAAIAALGGLGGLALWRRRR